MTDFKKKYGFWSSVALVVGVVIGCGVFVKAGDVLRASGGNFTISMLAWLVGGLIMIVSGFCFAKFATKITKFNGLVDYVEVSAGKKLAYFVAYFIAILYFPIVGSNLAFVGARYLYFLFTGVALAISAWQIYVIGFLLITLFTAINYLAPRISNYLRVSVTFIKLIPIFVLIFIGFFAPMIFGPGHSIIDPFKEATPKGLATNFGEAVKITSFAYDGWICATALNAEIKDSKKTLPRALIFGTIAVIIFYLLYFLSLSVILTNKTVMEDGAFAPIHAFINIMGDAGSKVFIAFIFISCLGNINAMELCSSQGFIAMGVRGEGFFPKRMCLVKNDKFTIMPHLFAYITTVLFLFIWYLANNNIWIFSYLQNMDCVVCSLIYMLYIVVYIYIIKNFKEYSIITRYIMPILAILGSLFFAFCGTGLYQLIFTHDTSSIISFALFSAMLIILFIPGIFVYQHKVQKRV